MGVREGESGCVKQRGRTFCRGKHQVDFCVQSNLAQHWILSHPGLLRDRDRDGDGDGDGDRDGDGDIGSVLVT